MDSQMVKLLKVVIPLAVILVLVFAYSILMGRKHEVSQTQAMNVNADEQRSHDELSLLTRRLNDLIVASDKTDNQYDRAQLNSNILPVAQARKELLLKNLQTNPNDFQIIAQQQTLGVGSDSLTLRDLQNQGLVENQVELLGNISHGSSPNDPDTVYTLQLSSTPNTYYVVHTDHRLADKIVNHTVGIKGWLLDKTMVVNATDVSLD